MNVWKAKYNALRKLVNEEDVRHAEKFIEIAIKLSNTSNYSLDDIVCAMLHCLPAHQIELEEV